MNTSETNAFEQLGRDDRPDAVPDPAFARRLRGQIEAALDANRSSIDLPSRRPPPTTEQEPAMTTETTPATEQEPAMTEQTPATDLEAPSPTEQRITPYISVHDGAGAIDWYVDALGARETMRFTGDDGRVGHAELIVQGARIYLSDAYPEIGVVAATSHEGSSSALHLEVDDCDAVHARAVELGATSTRPPEDQGHGSRTATVVDPYGHRWMFSQQIATPTIAEIDEATDGFTVEDRTGD